MNIDKALTKKGDNYPDGFWDDYYQRIIYKYIKTKENYNKLLASGILLEVYPELSGNWEKDKDVINK